MRQDLLSDEQTQLERQISKCPEIVIKFNDDITVNALIDTGSAINGLAEEWFERNKQRLRPYEELRMNNMLIVSAVGRKSKLIRKQIMCEISIDNVKLDCVFLVIPNLIRDCILGISFLKEEGCIIDMNQGTVEFRGRTGEQELQLPIVHMELIEEDLNGIERRINEKVDGVTCEDETTREELRRILLKCKKVFRESPGRMDCYEHEFKVTDETPYFQCGWPIPIACLLYTSRCV